MSLYRVAHPIVKGLYRCLYRLRVMGRENVPEGAALVCANHSSLADPVVAGLALKASDRIRFMAKQELFDIFAFRRLIKALGAYPVERGTSDMAAIRTTLELLREGNKVLLFPQGHRFITGGEEAEMKAGAALLAFRSGAPILPVYITVGRKPFFNRIQVVFGKPFTAEKQPGVKSSEQNAAIAERLRREIYGLKAQTVKKRGGDA